ncbi:hypothetical protein ABK040_006342 [Willaertia magna]
MSFPKQQQSFVYSHRQSPLPLSLLLFFIFLFTKLIDVTYSQLNVNNTNFYASKPINQLQNNDTIIGVEYWYYLTSLKAKQVDINNVINNNSTNNNNTIVDIRLYRLAYPIEYDFIVKYVSTIYPNNIELVPAAFWYSDCYYGSPYEIYDGYIRESSRQFIKEIRQTRDIFEGDKYLLENRTLRNGDNERMYQPYFDFNFLPFIPYKVYVLDKELINYHLKVNSKVDISSEIIKKLTTNVTSVLKNQNSSDCFTHDSNWLRYYFNMTTSDLEKLQQVFNIKLHLDLSYINTAIKNIKQKNPKSLWQSQSMTHEEILQQLFNATCHSCPSSACIEDIGQYDSMNISIASLMFLFYFGLAFSFYLPSLKRRLLIPYICPFLLFCYYMFGITQFNNVCRTIAPALKIFVMIFIISLYSMTILRYFYLRNLYSILKTTKYIQMHKIFASTAFGIAVTLLVPLFISLPFLGMIDYFKNVFLTYVKSLVLNTITCISFAVCSFIGSVSVIFDMILNRKILKTKGLKYLLFFDDPFYIRIDLISLVLTASLWLILIPLSLDEVVGGTIPTSQRSDLIGAFNILVGICMYMNFGGTSMLFELAKFLQKHLDKNARQMPSVGELEQKLLDNNFASLFYDYCQKEFSLENLLLYYKLFDLKKRGSVSIEQLQEMEEIFIKPYSMYQVNIPSSAKKKFHNLMNEKKVPYSRLSGCLHECILENLNDTYTRLLQTDEYKRWEQAVLLQKKTAVI